MTLNLLEPDFEGVMAIASPRQSDRSNLRDYLLADWVVVIT